MEPSLCQIQICQELAQLILGHLGALWVIREMQQNVGQLDVSMNHVQSPDFNQCHYDLPQYETDLGLSQCFPHLEQYCQVASVAVLHHHVNVRAGLDGLVQPDAEVALHQVVETHLLFDTIHLILCDVNDLDDLAGVSLINFGLYFILLLGFANDAILSLAENLFKVNEVVRDLTHVWRIRCLLLRLAN